MRALTVRQPWAWAIIHGQKDVENRSRNIAGSYRGPIAITASAKRSDDPQYVRDALDDMAARGLPRKEEITDPATFASFGSTLYVGAVLGVVDLVDVHAMWADEDGCCDRCISRWAQQSPYHLVLANPRPLPTPIPVHGRLGLWTLPVDIAAQVEEALR